MPIVCDLIGKYPSIDAKLVVSGAGVVGAGAGAGHGSQGSKSIPDYVQLVVNKTEDLTSIVNPKIRNMLPAYETAKHKLIFISDCHIEGKTNIL